MKNKIISTLLISGTICVAVFYCIFSGNISVDSKEEADVILRILLISVFLSGSVFFSAICTALFVLKRPTTWHYLRKLIGVMTFCVSGLIALASLLAVVSFTGEFIGFISIFPDFVTDVINGSIALALLYRLCRILYKYYTRLEETPLDQVI